MKKWIDKAMNTNLTKDNLFVQADSCRQLAKKNMDKRDIFKAQLSTLKANNSPKSEIEKLENGIGELDQRIPELLTQATSLDARGILGALTNLEESHNRIQASTNKVLKAVEKLNDIKGVLKVVDMFIRLGAAILGAIKTGGNPPAQISQIVEAIDNFTQEMGII